HERVLVYLNVCERQRAPAAPATPKSTAERLYAATLALNSEDFDQALAHIGQAISGDPASNHAHYMRGVALTQRGEYAEALSCLARAIQLSPENRALVRQDTDLDALRRHDGMRKSLEALLAAPRPERRRAGSRSRRSK